MSNFTTFDQEYLARLLEPFILGVTPHITSIKYEALTPDRFVFLFRTTDSQNEEHYFVSLETDHIRSMDDAKKIIEDWHGKVIKFSKPHAQVKPSGDDQRELNEYQYLVDDTYVAMLAEVERPNKGGYWAEAIVIRPGDHIGDKIKHLSEKDQANARKALADILHHKTDPNASFLESYEARRQDTMTGDINKTDTIVSVYVEPDGNVELFYNYAHPMIGGRELQTDNQFDHFIDPEAILDSKLFFYLNIYARDNAGMLHYLVFHANGAQQYLADRVMPGDSLKAAISKELQQDFQIKHWSFIGPVTFSDDTQDNQGKPVKRVNVYLSVPYFDVAGKKVIGMDMQWLAVEKPKEEPKEEAQPTATEKPIITRTVTREELIAAYKPYIEQGIQNPYEIKSPELSALEEAYHKQQAEARTHQSLEERIRSEVAEYTIYYDAGFTDWDLLDEIAADWLTNPLSRADDVHRRDLANEVIAKMIEIQKRIKELRPDYEIAEWKLGEPELWNPSRTAGPKEFYADYAYWKGPQHTHIDDALAEYKKYHPDADDQAIRAEMEEAAAEYKES